MRDRLCSMRCVARSMPTTTIGVAAILGSEVVLSPVVSGCLPSCGVGVGWRGRLLGL